MSSDMPWLPIAVAGGVLVFKDDIAKFLRESLGAHDTPSVASEIKNGPLCPGCASKQAGRAAIWRDRCVQCRGPCAVVPDNKEVVDSVMRAMYAGTASNTTRRTEQMPPFSPEQPAANHARGLLDIANDPSQGPINIAREEGSANTRADLLDADNRAPQYNMSGGAHQPAYSSFGTQQQQDANQYAQTDSGSGGFGVAVPTIDGQAAPSTLPAEEGDAFPGAAYAGMMP